MDERYGEVLTAAKQEKDDVNVDEVVQAVKELDAEIEAYKNLIKDAEAAMNSAEKDMGQILDELPFN